MAYFGSAAGMRGPNNNRRARGGRRPVGDPGFFDTLKNIAGWVGGQFTAHGGQVTLPQFWQPTPDPEIQPVPGILGAAQRQFPFLQPITGGIGWQVAPRRRRRTNFANPRALNRAIRRVEGFGRLVQRSKKSVAKANRALNPATPRRQAAIPAGHRARLTH